MGIRMRYGTEADLSTYHAEEPRVTETLLWENTDPTATFNAKDVTLSQAVDSFTYLKIVYAWTRATAESNFGYIIIPVWNVDGTDYLYKYRSSSTAGLMASISGHDTSDKRRSRTFWILSGGTKIHFFATYTHSGDTANASLIPVYIYGIK